MARGHHAGGSVEHGPEVVAVAPFGFAGRDPHAHWQLQVPLGIHRGVDGGLRGAEGGAYPVTGMLEYPTAVTCYGTTQHFVVGSQRSPHSARVFLPPLCGSLDVGEQESDDATRPGHGSSARARSIWSNAYFTISALVIAIPARANSW